MRVGVNCWSFFCSKPSWWLPRGERLLLAIIGGAFWAGTISHALNREVTPNGVYSLFGLGLVYLLFTLANLRGAVRAAMRRYRAGRESQSHVRPLVELGVVLEVMLWSNVAVLGVYVSRATPIFWLDYLSFFAAAVLLAIVATRYGRQMLVHPLARGWLAIAGKALPQLILAVWFVLQPAAAASLAFVTLFGINALSLLRFLPVWRSERASQGSLYLQGLLLGEGGNVITALLLTTAWLFAMVR